MPSRTGEPTAVFECLASQIEGAEYDALKHFDFGRYRFLLLTIERPVAALRALLRANSYAFIKDNGCFGDQLWAHTSIAEQAHRALGPPFANDPQAYGPDFNACCHESAGARFVKGATIDNGCCGAVSPGQEECVKALGR